MDAFNLALTRLVDWLFDWCASLPPVVTLVVWSAVAGVLMTVVFLYTSNQQAVATAADRARAQVLAINLFGHDLGMVFRCLGQLLKFTGLRLWHSLPPVLVMLIPFVLLLSQLALRYEYRPLTRGEAAIVKLEVKESEWQTVQEVALVESAQIAVETPPVRDTQEHAIYWRIRPKAASPAALQWRFGDESVEKRVDIAADDDRLAIVSARRAGRGWLDRILHPGEPALPSEVPVSGVEIVHPPRETPFAGINLPWWLTFFLASIVAALVVRPVLRVRF